MMISFIVIGKNEARHLRKCFESITKTIKYYDINKYEVIYIDSNSSDNSVEIAKDFDFIKIYRIIRFCNAAIARNIGAKESRGDILFFIDGDMELFPDFLSFVLNKKGKLIYEFISGYYYNYFYDDSGNLIRKNQYPKKDKISLSYFEPSTGGLFIISKNAWESVGGMKNYLFSYEDPDLALRLAKKGILKLRINKPMAIHHTEIERDKYKLNSMFRKTFLNGIILIIRDNLFSLYGFNFLIKRQFSVFLFFISMFFFIIYSNFFFLLPYLIFQLIRTFKRKKQKFSSFFFLIIKDIFIVFGLFFYHPKKKYFPTYEQVK